MVNLKVGGVKEDENNSNLFRWNIDKMANGTMYSPNSLAIELKLWMQVEFCRNINVVGESLTSYCEVYIF